MKILLFSSESFSVLYFTFWSMIHFRFVLYKMEGLKWLRAFCVLYTKNFPAPFVCQDYPFSINCFGILVKPVSPVHMGLLCPLCSVPLIYLLEYIVNICQYHELSWLLLLYVKSRFSYSSSRLSINFISLQKKKKILLQLLSGLH